MLCIAGVVGGGSGHVFGGSPMLCADPRSVYDSVCCVLQELLEEARVMFSVDHPCCVRILAVCMTVCVVYCRSCWRRLESCSRWITRAVCGSSQCV